VVSCNIDQLTCLCLLVIFSDENKPQKEAVPSVSTHSKFVHMLCLNGFMQWP